MLKDGKPFCDECGKEMRIVSDEEAERTGEPNGFGLPAHAHVCNECFDALHHAAWEDRDPCGECETQPCKRGRDCWFEPNIGYPYETYFADLKTEAAA